MYDLYNLQQKKHTCLFVKHLSADPLTVFQLLNKISESKQKIIFKNGLNWVWFPW